MSRPVKLLSATQILDAADLPTEVVEVPEWGGAVRIRALSGTERDAWEASLVTGQGRTRKLDTKNIRASLCARVMVDEDGTPLFQPFQVEALGRKSAAALDRVYEAASRLSKLTPQDVEELAGNSGAEETQASGDAGS